MKLQIYTLEGTKFEGEVSEVSLPTRDGEITVLKGHIPLITILNSGKIKTSSEEIFIEGGVAEIDGQKVVVLAN